MTNVVEVMRREIEELISPLVEIAISEDPLTELRRFLAASGWMVTTEIDPAPIVGGILALTEAVDAVSDELDPEDMAAFVAAVDGVHALVTAVESLVELIARGGLTSPTDGEMALFAEDVLGWMWARWLARKRVIGDLAPLLGLIDAVDVPAATLGGWLQRPEGRVFRLRLTALTTFVADPLAYIRSRLAPHGWTTSEDATATNLYLYRALTPLLLRMGGLWRPHPDALASADDVRTSGRTALLDVVVPVADEQGRVSFGAEIEFFSAADLDGSGRSGPGVALAPFGGYHHTFLFEGWSVTLGAMVMLGGVDAGDSPPAIRVDLSGIDVDPSVDAVIEAAASLDLAVLVGGRGTRLELGTLELRAAGGVEGGDLDIGYGVVASGSRIVLSAADLGEAIAAVAAFEKTIDLDLGVAWSRATGLTLAGAASLEFELTEGIDIGGVISLSGLRVRLELDDIITLAALTDASVNLGPVAMAFERLGLGIELALSGGADRPFSLTLAPPKGIGVRVDAGVVVGGGYLSLDPDNGEYAGVLELSFPALSLSLKAVGIFTTKLPGGAEGYALLLLVYTEFPAVQLGYGFTLNGVGGILGIQHGVSTDALSAGLRTGALDRVLFPMDPVAQAPRLLADLRATFPISSGSLTFGPALQIGWGAGILTLTLAVVIQFDDVIGSGAGDPSIARIVLLGQLRVKLPPVDGVPELVKLLVDVVGWFEVDQLELAIDARLRDSHIAGLPLTGSLVVRARFGADPTFLLAVGGFHPRFTDLPPGLPPQDRVGFQLVHGIVRVQVVAYLAITSNSFQVGANASLVASAGGFRVEAYLGFDALFRFEPRFSFEIDFRVGAAISWKSWDLVAIRFSGALTGPGRWEIRGHASFTVLFWDEQIDVNEAWGLAPATPLPQVAVLPQVIQALSSPDAWTTSLPTARQYVTLRQHRVDEVVAHPMGQLHVRQKVVPFGITVDRVGQSRPTDVTRFTMEKVTVGGTIFSGAAIAMSQEHFARGQYLDLSEDAKLTEPSFERFDAGAAVGSDAFTVPEVEVAFDPECETKYLEAPDDTQYLALNGLLLYELVWLGAAAHSPLRRQEQLLAAGVIGLQVTDAHHVIVDAATLAVDPELSTLDGALAGTGLGFTGASQTADQTHGAKVVLEAAEVLK